MTLSHLKILSDNITQGWGNHVEHELRVEWACVTECGNKHNVALMTYEKWGDSEGSVEIPTDRNMHVRQRELFSKFNSKTWREDATQIAINRRIILKWILNNWCVRMWNEFIWLSTEKIEGFCEYGNGRHFINGEEFRTVNFEQTALLRRLT